MYHFYFVRAVRTPASESYLIWLQRGPSDERSRVGTLDLHFVERVIHGKLVLESGLLDMERDSLLEQIDHQIIGDDRDDYIFSVYLARDIGFYSDTISEEDRSSRTATLADIESIRAPLTQVVGRHQTARGKLAEHAVVSDFESQGYSANLAGGELHALKVDVIAQSEEEIIFAQSKLGSIAATEIRKIVESVAQLPAPTEKIVCAAIIAKTFPKGMEFLRRALEREFGISILCIQLYQVTNACPEYKGPLGV